MSQPMLPGMPGDPVMRKVGRFPSGMRVTRVRPTRLCEQCCAAIHRWGQAGAPYPRAGRWKVATDEWEMRLCDTHKDERVGR